MTDHLPECACNHADERGCFLISAETDRCVDCICPQLRACQQRVRADDALWLDGYEHGMKDAYDAVDKGGRAAAQIDALARLRSVTL